MDRIDIHDSLCAKSQKTVRNSASTLLKDVEEKKHNPCFFLAPNNCGQEEFLAAYLNTGNKNLTVWSFIVTSDGSCHPAEQQPYLDRNTKGNKIADAEAGLLAVIHHISWLEDDAAQLLSEEIDRLLAEGCQVWVFCPVQYDRYANLQSDRMEISASELKTCGYFTASAYTESLKQFMAEFLPIQVRLLALFTALFGRTTLTELSELGYQLSGDLPRLLEELHPLFYTTDNSGELCAEAIDIHQVSEELQAIIREHLNELGKPADTSALASRITMLSIALLERGELESSHEILEIAEDLLRRQTEISAGRAEMSKTNLTAGGSDDQKQDFSVLSPGVYPGFLNAGSEYKTRYTTRASLTPLSLHLFGQMQITLDGVVLRNKYVSRTKIRRLLAYIALSQKQAVSRDGLVDYLWPYLDFERAQKNLYTSWCMLAKALGAEKVRSCPYIQRSGELYLLNQELVICDTDQFEAEARKILFGQTDTETQTQCLLNMDALYRDTLVADIPGDSYLVTRMERYRSMMVDALLLVSKQLRSAGELEKALYCARSAYALDDTREDVYRELMDSQLEAGQRTSAMQTYFSCKRYLSDELGILPSRRTTALYQDLLLDTCR